MAENWSAAREVYEAAPQAITAILARINVHLLVGDLQQASKFARSGLQSDPDNVRLKSVYKRIKGVLHLQGDAEQQIRAHNHAAALQTWKEILAVSPLGFFPCAMFSLIVSVLKISRSPIFRRMVEGVRYVPQCCTIKRRRKQG